MVRMLVAVLLGTVLAGCQQSPGVQRLPPVPNLDAPQVRLTQRQDARVGPSATPVPLKQPNLKNATPDVPLDWIPRVALNNWRWIVVHHSATPAGSALQFDRSHRQKGWDELGYHFVIGNGTGSADGQVEVGSRWTKQKWGAHTKTPDNQYNDFGIGICLVGDFDVDRPTAAQMQALARLVAYLMKTYHIPEDRVIGHSDAKPTHCPGAHVNMADIRQRASRLVRGGAELPANSRTAGLFNPPAAGIR